MSTMIERVAQAIATESNKGAAWDLPIEIFIDQARAAIEAMREPTVDMICCGSVEYVKTSNTAAVFTSMIDAALEEKP